MKYSAVNCGGWKFKWIYGRTDGHFCNDVCKKPIVGNNKTKPNMTITILLEDLKLMIILQASAMNGRTVLVRDHQLYVQYR